MLKSIALIVALSASFAASLTSNADAAWRPAFGWSFDYGSQHAANVAALRKCEGYCKIAVTFYNACGAVAVSSNKRWFGRWAPGRGDAEYRAMSACRSAGPDCYVPRWVCSGSGYGAIAVGS